MKQTCQPLQNNKSGDICLEILPKTFEKPRDLAKILEILAGHFFSSDKFKKQFTLNKAFLL